MLNLEDDLRRIIMARLPLKDSNYSTKLEKLDLNELIIRYFNWMSRLIPAQRRNVQRSTDLVKNPAYLQHRPDIDRLLGKIAIGMDLTPHLSTQIEIGYEENKKGQPGRRSLDLC